MKRRFQIITFCLILMSFPVLTANAQENDQKIDDETLLELYKGLRVADVSDGMDMVGLRDMGLMDQKIQALWKDIENFDHTFCGIAVTARYVPTNDVIKNPMSKEEFQQWEGEWYNNKSPEPFVKFLESGSIVVIDVEGDGDTGSVGSYNGLSWISKGARGIVSNGGVRDTDELIKEKVPVYFDPENRGRGIRPGRNEIESVNETVTIGGVQVNPGDVVVADGDGVIVVPRKHAKQVAQYAREILESDKEARRNLYEQMDKPLDETVK
ncbi:MAG: RraA family protein [Bacteroidales bacterium]|nr:RraA family protein [Bacteroidales bacterium]